MRSGLRRLAVAVAAVTVAAAGSVAVSADVATAAASDACSYTMRLNTDDISTGNLGYIGYVEMRYSSGCHRVEAVMHIDSGFAASHSGWNARVTIRTTQGFSAATPYRNTSQSDLLSPSVSIWGQSTEQFQADVDWTYNCNELETVTAAWDFSNGTVVGSPNGSGRWLC
ncbi:hypothetical protein ABZ915_46650 [Streptomyces sp. NPDC046915]|uniref:hypothetical protein n=1 Tax=Streptomyces sp. NPDC046915 TaxID=3155257 RepID=UPI003406BC47